MACDGAVCGFVLVFSIGRNENRGHHCKRTECGGNHIAHHVAIVVFASPNKAALAANNACNRIVDKRIEILDPCSFKRFFIIVIVDLLEDELKGLVILLGDGILCRKPKILLSVERILEARMCKGANGIILVVASLQNARALKIINRLAEGLIPLFIGKNELCLSLGGNAILGCLIDITVSVTRNGDRLFPIANGRTNRINENGSAENGTVENGTDSSVRALPHLGEIIFFYTLLVGRDGCTLYCNAVFLSCVCRVKGNLIFRFFTLGETEIVIFGFEIDKWEKKLILDHLPKNSCHFVAIHFDQRCFHLNLTHLILLLCLLELFFCICQKAACLENCFLTLTKGANKRNFFAGRFIL